METALVGVILTFIAIVVVTQLSTSRNQRLIERDAHNRVIIDAAAARYHRENGVWPSADLQELVGEAHLENGIPKSPFPPYEPYRLDPQTHRAVKSAAVVD